MHLERSEVGRTAFSEDKFSLLVDMISEGVLIDVPGGYVLLQAFWVDWEKFSETQTDRFLAALERTYRDLTDQTACFHVSVALGEWFCNARAVDTLGRLAGSTPEMPRTYVPHALEHIVIASKDRRAARQAWDLLKVMTKDEFESVRCCALRSLDHAADKGFT
jgi:hypothetical protein